MTALFRFGPLVGPRRRLKAEVGDWPPVTLRDVGPATFVASVPLARSAEIGQDPLTVGPFRFLEGQRRLSMSAR